MEQTLLAQAAGSRPSPSEDIAQLRAILAVVDELAGRSAAAPLQEDPATLDARYAGAPDLIRARYARAASRTASFSAAGVAALIAANPGTEQARRSAAEYLAGEMRHAIRKMVAALK